MNNSKSNKKIEILKNKYKNISYEDWEKKIKFLRKHSLFNNQKNYDKEQNVFIKKFMIINNQKELISEINWKKESSLLIRLLMLKLNKNLSNISNLILLKKENNKNNIILIKKMFEINSELPKFEK